MTLMNHLMLDPADFQTVKSILKQYVPHLQVVAFGSRVSKQCKKHTDLDLCILGKHALSLQEEANLKEAFSESNLPIRVDIVHWAALSSEFKKIIQQTGVVL